MAEVPLSEVAGAILIDAAREAAGNAYCPYSGFAVGAAILLTDGEIVSAANLENASYGLSLCAETLAVGAANSLGRLADIAAIGVIGGRVTRGGIEGDAAVRPCGRCRQLLSEAAQVAGRDIAVYCASADGTVVEHHMLSALLPLAFGPAELRHPR